VRQQVRICWRVYNEEFSERVAALLHDMRGPAKKQIQQELASSSVAAKTLKPISKQASTLLTSNRGSIALPKPA